MTITKSDIENDVKRLMSSLENDYEIPTSWMIIKPIINKMLVVYCMLFLAAIINGVVYYDKEYPLEIFLAGCFFSAIASIVLTVTALIMTYGNLSILMCIPKNVRDNSLLINLGKKKIMTYGYVIVAINVVVAIVLISERRDFIIGYGISWFACMIIGGITFSMSMSRYMTPAVIATLDKIRQVVSSEANGKQLHE